MKKTLFWSFLLLMAAFTGLTACGSDDDDENDEVVAFYVESVQRAIIGKWQFVEMLDGVGASMETHRGAPQPPKHTVEFTRNQNVYYHYADGTSREGVYVFPDVQEVYQSSFPVVQLGPTADEAMHCDVIYFVPYSVEVTKKTLKLHYVGIYTTDHIPETFVYRKI